MLLSRGIGVLNACRQIARPKVNGTSLVPSRSSGHHFAYRGLRPASKQQVLVAEIIGGIAWWWVLWHIWHDHAHLTGEWEEPDLKSLSDEELGIPPL